MVPRKSRLSAPARATPASSACGLRVLKAADVVVYDHLVHARPLAFGADAELIDVGPAAPEPMHQDAIRFLLAEKARGQVRRPPEGATPTSSTAAAARRCPARAGVPFEVIPGIPAAIGAAGYAGCRSRIRAPAMSSSSSEATRPRRTTRLDVDWARLAGLTGTIVCFASARQLAAIVRKLVANGKSPDEPAALIYHGTMPEQKTIDGSLADVAEEAARSQLRTPAIPSLAPWPACAITFAGSTNVRSSAAGSSSRVHASRQASLVEMLEDLGAEAIEAPAIRIVSPDDMTALDQAAADASSYDWIVFTSANGVDHGMRRLLAGPNDVRSLGGGRSARSALRRPAGCALRDQGRPDAGGVSRRSHHGRAARRGRPEGQAVLLPRADIARELLAEQLREAGADVTEVAAYRTLPADGSGEREGDRDVYRMLLDRQQDAITSTSASTVRSFVQMLGEEPARDLLRTTVVASIGPGHSRWRSSSASRPR